MNDLPTQVVDVEFHRFGGRYFQVRHQSFLVYIDKIPHYFRHCMN
jgi:hypothetical protein